jgi:hypothetical protein
MRVDLQWRAARDGQAEDDRRELVYRLCFDRLFAHLAEAHRLLAQGRVAEADLRGLAYYLERIENYEYPPPGVAGDAMFVDFLGYAPYGYRPVRALAARLLKGPQGHAARAAVAAWEVGGRDALPDAGEARTSHAGPNSPRAGTAWSSTPQERGGKG